MRLTCLDGLRASGGQATLGVPEALGGSYVGVTLGFRSDTP